MQARSSAAARRGWGWAAAAGMRSWWPRAPSHCWATTTSGPVQSLRAELRELDISCSKRAEEGRLVASKLLRAPRGRAAAAGAVANRARLPLPAAAGHLRLAQSCRTVAAAGHDACSAPRQRRPLMCPALLPTLMKGSSSASSASAWSEGRPIMEAILLVGSVQGFASSAW